MHTDQLTFWDDDRMNPQKAMALTAESLLAYAQTYRHWALAYSGGKDSTAAVAIVTHLIETGAVPAPASLTVLYADTRMELPPLQISAMRMMAALEARGTTCRVVLPPMDRRFMVYMLGRGVPPPTNRFRWCTPSIKVEPMLDALRGLRDSTSEKLLMLTGVRVGESAARDQRIALSCGRDGAECGQGWFQETTPESIADTLAPLLHWRVCQVWDVLRHEAPKWGLPTAVVADCYGGDRAEEIAARTGCVGCNLASRDNALDRVLRIPAWGYLAPLKRLRPLYAHLRLASNRLRKHGEVLKSGATRDTDRLGPLTFDARLRALDSVLAIQQDINAARPSNLPEFSLIDGEEEARIRELIDLKTWPERWDGTEDVGDVLRPVRFTKGGGRQMQMMIDAAIESD